MKRSKRRYVFCLAGLFLLALTAFFGPQFLFQIQDDYRLEQIFKEERSGPDIRNLNYTYENRIGERMSNFASGLAQGKEYRIVSTDYTVNQEIWKFALKVRNQEWIRRLKDAGMLPFVVDGASEVLECKKYVIYEEKLEDGATLILWYLKVRLAETDMILLLDAQSESIYYMDLIKLASGDTGTTLDAVVEYFYPYEQVWTELYKTYYVDYYEGNNGRGETIDKKIKTEMIVIARNESRLNFELSYGVNSLDFEVLYEGGGSVKDVRRMRIGIREIAELIPEMIQE